MKRLLLCALLALPSWGATIHSYEFSPVSYTANGVTIALADLTGGPVETTYYGRFDLPFGISVSGAPTELPTELVLWRYTDTIPTSLTLDIEQRNPIVAREVVTLNLLAVVQMDVSPFGLHRAAIGFCPLGCDAAAITQGEVRAMGSPKYAVAVGDFPGPGELALAARSYAIPEPGTWLLLASGLGLIAIARLRSAQGGR